MDSKVIKSILEIGETIAVEFKRCGNGIENDVYESVCSFLNRFGGDIFLGVQDDGTVCGVPERAASDMVKNFISCISNPVLFTPTIYLSPKIVRYEGKTIIHVHVLPSAEVHSFKKTIYDRVDDADVKVTSTSQIAQMYIRKQEIFTERKVYPYVKKLDLRLDMLPQLRVMASNQSNGQGHPWSKMTDDELLKSARLYTMDRVTGEQGFNLAAVMLLGKDDVILDIVPAYVTDALLRRVNVDRYDDREIVQTNLIESYERLMEFGRKHLLDYFFLEDDQRKSLRNIITREMIANTLIHREYTSSYQLGSGVRNLFKYSKFYSGKNPEFIEGDIFRIIVPLKEEQEEITTQSTQSATQSTQSATHLNGMDSIQEIMKLIGQDPFLSQKQMAEKLHLNQNTLKYYIKKMREKGMIERVGSSRKGKWILK